jgi:endonuclease G
MKRLVLSLILILFVFFGLAQDTVTIHHQRYSTTFDRQLKYPVLVHWVVYASDLCDNGESNRVERSTGGFKSDPLLKAYTNLQKYYSKNPEKYQRGHNMNAADNSCDLIQMKECFYFSNITPQTAELNEDTWGDLEDQTRKLARQFGQVEVWCGSYAFKSKMGVVTVPLFCWKILRYNGHVKAYIFPNHHLVNQRPYSFYLATVSSIRVASKLPLLEINER